MHLRHPQPHEDVTAAARPNCAFLSVQRDGWPHCFVVTTKKVPVCSACNKGKGSFFFFAKYNSDILHEVQHFFFSIFLMGREQCLE